MRKITLALLLLFVSSALFAHDTWVLPDNFSIAPGSKATLELTSGMKFPALETGPKRVRVQSAQYRLAGETVPITEIAESKEALRFVAQPAAAGVATLWVVFPAKEIELQPAQVQEYLDEIAAPEKIRKEWAEMKKPGRWRELYTKHPNTFLRVGVPEGDRSWADPVGQELEIIPEKDPTGLQVGDELPVRILKSGAPYKDFALNAVAAGETKGETRKTDSEGRVVFRFDRAGPWLLRGTDVRKSTKPDADWESDFTTLTLQVKKGEGDE